MKPGNQHDSMQGANSCRIHMILRDEQSDHVYAPSSTQKKAFFVPPTSSFPIF